MNHHDGLGDPPTPVAEPPVDDARPDAIDTESPGVRDERLPRDPATDDAAG